MWWFLIICSDNQSFVFFFKIKKDKNGSMLYQIQWARYIG